MLVRFSIFGRLPSYCTHISAFMDFLLFARYFHHTCMYMNVCVCVFVFSVFFFIRLLCFCFVHSFAFAFNIRQVSECEHAFTQSYVNGNIMLFSFLGRFIFGFSFSPKFFLHSSSSYSIRWLYYPILWLHHHIFDGNSTHMKNWIVRDNPIVLHTNTHDDSTFFSYFAHIYTQCLYLLSPFIWFYFICIYKYVCVYWVFIGFLPSNVCPNNLDSIGFSVLLLCALVSVLLNIWKSGLDM